MRRYCKMAKKTETKNDVKEVKKDNDAVFSTSKLSNTDLDEMIHVMIKIDPKMDFCIKGQMPTAAAGMNYSMIECISSVVIQDGDERYIYLLLKGSGMITITETEFNKALNAKGLNKSLKTFLKLYFQLEKPKEKSKEKSKSKKPKTSKSKKEEN